MSNEDFVRSYASSVANCLRQIDPGPVLAAITALHDAWKAGKVVLFCGNGGSGASCSHIVNDLQKNIGMETGRPLKALCLSDCTPLMAAWANDTSWDNVFAPQVAAWAEPGAVLVAVSGSGGSYNILNAVKEAKRNGLPTVGLTGFGGGCLAKSVDISIHVPTDNMQQAEDAHMVVLHMFYLGLARRIQEGAAGG